MVHFFSLKSNVPILASFTQSEITAIEQILASNGIHVNIELIENGAIVYIADTFPKEQLLKFRSIYLRETQLLDNNHLPARYMTWHDSFTGETIHFVAPVEQYLRNKMEAIKVFLEPNSGAKIIAEFYKRIIKK